MTPRCRVHGIELFRDLAGVPHCRECRKDARTDREQRIAQLTERAAQQRRVLTSQEASA